ncbi:signal-transducing adaptor protein 1-like [Engraulis encrasicolus]|uniref:signal-transducing adaptor protein 1-like n=1 Tax=Engraulis encrasicolus TaxID=184585 RepID=UPI002FD321F4
MQQGTLGRGQQEGIASSPPGHGAGTGLGMAAPSRMIFKRRANATALPLHYSGHIQKKYTGEGGFRTYFGELRGSSLFFYSDEKQENYTERLELHDLNSMVPVASYSPRAAPIYTLSFPYEEVQLKIDNPDTGELWRGFILTVAKLDVPRDLQLLPGQFMMLENVKTEEQQRRVLLEQEQQRRVLLLHTTSSDAPDSTDTDTDQEYDDSLSILPTCFLEVSREEAESQLLKNPESGSIILRPATDKKNYSATTRQDFPSGPVIKNYKIITTSDQQFTIQLDSPVTVSSLKAVVEYFMKETTNQLKPFTPRAYDTRIACQ